MRASTAVRQLIPQAMVLDRLGSRVRSRASLVRRIVQDRARRTKVITDSATVRVRLVIVAAADRPWRSDRIRALCPNSPPAHAAPHGPGNLIKVARGIRLARLHGADAAPQRGQVVSIDGLANVNFDGLAAYEERSGRPPPHPPPPMGVLARVRQAATAATQVMRRGRQTQAKQEGKDRSRLRQYYFGSAGPVAQGYGGPRTAGGGDGRRGCTP